MKINVTTTIEIEKEDINKLNNKDVLEAYNEFMKVAKIALESKDLTPFSFINPETGHELEYDDSKTNLR